MPSECFLKPKNAAVNPGKSWRAYNDLVIKRLECRSHEGTVLLNAVAQVGKKVTFGD